MQGVHLLQGGAGQRENRELFREGVEGRHTKIRPLVPKKTLAPPKALERGSSAWNVTPGRASAGLGNEVSLQDQCDRPMAGGHGHLSFSRPTWKILELVLTASCLHQVSGKVKGQSCPFLAQYDLPGWLCFSFLDHPFASCAFCSILGVCMCVAHKKRPS